MKRKFLAKLQDMEQQMESAQARAGQLEKAKNRLQGELEDTMVEVDRVGSQFCAEQRSAPNTFPFGVFEERTTACWVQRPTWPTTTACSLPLCSKKHTNRKPSSRSTLALSVSRPTPSPPRQTSVSVSTTKR